MLKKISFLFGALLLFTPFAHAQIESADDGSLSTSGVAVQSWAGYDFEYDLGNNAWVNTGDWIGYVLVQYAPWIYIADTGTWVYMVEPNLVDAGAWGFFTK